MSTTVIRFLAVLLVAILIYRDPQKVAGWFGRRLLLALAIIAIITIGSALFGGCSGA